jgi:hypothetical protein
VSDIAAHEPDPQAESRPTPLEDVGDPPTSILRIKDLPKEVGVMLVSVGALGVVLPGMMGTPAVIAGGLVLWPSTFGKVERWFQRRYPAAHREGMKQIGRYLDDLDRRYPIRPDR